MKPRILSILGPAALLLMSACPEEDVRGIDTARSDMKPLVDSACDWMFGCCSPGELTYQLGDFTVDVDDCSDRLLNAISTGYPLDIQQTDLSSDPAEGLLVLALSINEGRVDVDSGAVRACADATSAQTCNAAIAVDPVGRCTPDDAMPAADPCDPNEMFSGRQDIGEPCDGPWECKDGLRCFDFGIAGVCAVRAPQGESCFADQECAEELVCDYESGTCQPGALAGEPCAFEDPMFPIPGTETLRCAEGLSCDPTTFVCVGGFCAPGAPCGDIFDDSDCPETYFCVGNSFTPYSCQAPGSVGAPCTKAADCQSSVCSPIDEVCSNLLGVGEACFDDDECDTSFCSFDTGLCEPAVGPGQPCPSFSDSECQGGYCDTADPAGPVCAAYVPEGGACTTGAECDFSEGLSCVNDTCLRPPFPLGTPCGDASQCESQACFNGECVEGLSIGDPCFLDGTTAPCTIGSFCDAPDGAIDGTCAELRRSGESCRRSDQCWGECVVRFGTQMCDSTPAFALEEVWCDGP